MCPSGTCSECSRPPVVEIYWRDWAGAYCAKCADKLLNDCEHWPLQMILIGPAKAA